MITPIDFSKLNLQDALDLAILVEEEAKERYEEFAAQIGSSYSGDASSFFNLMADNEAKHAQELKKVRENYFGQAPCSVDPQMIEAFRGTEAPAYDEIRPFMSPGHALSVALANEVKAHLFYQSALKQITNPVLKQFFTNLIAEEVEDQKMIKDLLRKIPKNLSPEIPSDEVDAPEL